MLARLKAMITRRIRNAVGHTEQMEHLARHLNDIAHRLSAIEHGQHGIRHISQENDRNRQDMLILLNKALKLLPQDPFIVETEYPVACTSNDHLHPRGAKNDNTRSPRFVLACERHFAGEKLDYLDLGCSGGGLVWDFLLRGHEAVGLEGSDYSLQNQRAEWRLLGNNRLFTADISRPFHLRSSNGQAFAAHIVSAWEFLEHIPEADLPHIFENVRQHLRPDGFFLGSIALFEDVDQGISYHPTVKPQKWWEAKFIEQGLPWTLEHSFTFGDFCRGVGNGVYDSNFLTNPEMGFHFVAQKR